MIPPPLPARSSQSRKYNLPHTHHMRKRFPLPAIPLRYSPQKAIYLPPPSEQGDIPPFRSRTNNSYCIELKRTLLRGTLHPLAPLNPILPIKETRRKISSRWLPSIPLLVLVTHVSYLRALSPLTFAKPLSLFLLSHYRDRETRKGEPIFPRHSYLLD